MAKEQGPREPYERPKRATPDDLRFDFEAKRTWAWNLICAIAGRGAAGRIDEKQAPGFNVGIRALSQIVSRTDPVREPGELPARVIPANVIVHVHGPAVIAAGNGQPGALEADHSRPGAGSQGNGVEVRIRRRNGGST